jgi:peptide alpha-N-acetyltransferase
VLYTIVRTLQIPIRILFVFVTENLAPAELKKLRNKQRKRLRKAELERQQAAQAQEKREQHNKSRQQGDAEPDAPQQDELVPEKLARVFIHFWPVF